MQGDGVRKPRIVRAAIFRFRGLRKTTIFGLRARNRANPFVGRRDAIKESCLGRRNGGFANVSPRLRRNFAFSGSWHASHWESRLNETPEVGGSNSRKRLHRFRVCAEQSWAR